jgi:hypothetical protein
MNNREIEVLLPAGVRDFFPNSVQKGCGIHSASYPRGPLGLEFRLQICHDYLLGLNIKRLDGVRDGIQHEDRHCNGHGAVVLTKNKFNSISIPQIKIW